MVHDKGGKIVRCVQCGRAYRVHSMYCGDQSLCPGCKRELEEEVQRNEREGYPPVWRFSIRERGKPGLLARKA